MIIMMKMSVYCLGFVEPTFDVGYVGIDIHIHTSQQSPRQKRQ